MFRGCVMSQARQLTTVNQTSFKSYLNRTPLTSITNPFKQQQQMLVFRSLSTASHGNFKGSELPPAASYISSFVLSDPQAIEVVAFAVALKFTIWIAVWLKKKHNYQKHVKEDKSIDGCLKYEIIGFKGVYDESVTAEIWNGRYLVVNGRIYDFLGRSVIVKREITLPNNDYAQANKKAKFYPDVGSVVVEISDFKKVQDIKIHVEEGKQKIASLKLQNLNSLE